MTHHAEGLRRLTGDGKLAGALARDHTRAGLDPADRAMLDHALKLTRAPATITREDLDLLRGHGFTDRALLDITLVAGYFAFVNRLADGLGVELEDRWRRGRG